MTETKYFSANALKYKKISAIILWLENAVMFLGGIILVCFTGVILFATFLLEMLVFNIKEIIEKFKRRI
jgi:hypothetical protein